MHTGCASLKPSNGVMLMAMAIANSKKKKKKEKKSGHYCARLQAHSGPGRHRGTGNQRRCHKEKDGGRLKPMAGNH